MPAVRNRSRGTARRHRLPLVLLALVLGLPAAPGTAQDDTGRPPGAEADPARPAAPMARAPENGQWVTLAGRVTDGGGEVLPGLKVVLEASRSFFSLRHLERREKDLRRVSTLTAEDGSYELLWRWDDYFNRLRLGVTVPVERSETRKAGYLEQVDVTRRLAATGSARVPLVIRDEEFVDALRRFEATIVSSEQQEIYRRLGYPDEVEVLALPGGREASWWYFDRGEVYRFADGRLTEVEPFEPVRSF